MKQNQKTRAWLFTLAALVVVLMSNVFVGRAEVITPKIKWEMSGNLYAISKPGRVLSTGTALVDLTNGKVLYRVKQDSGEVSIYLNYYGDRFYVQDTEPGGYFLKEYDTKTLKYLSKRYLYPSSPNGLAVKSGTLKNSYLFYNFDTGQLVDSVYFGTTMNFYNSTTDYSFDSKYYIINLTHTSGNYLFLYDFTSKEMIIKGQLNTPYCFFNKSNKLALGEYIKLPGDDKKYAYIRIYDPDQRKYIKDIKVGEHHFYDLTIKNEDDLLFYQIADDTGLKRIVDLETFIKLEPELIVSRLCYVDDSLMISSDLFSYEMDWSLVGVEDNKSIDDTIIYPNPTNNMISISISNDYFGGLWNISDFNGKICNKGIISPMPTLQIDLSRLINGNYFLTLVKDKTIKTFKIVKQ